MDHLPENQWATTMNLIDSNQDGKISLGEFQEYTNKQQVDTNTENYDLGSQTS